MVGLLLLLLALMGIVFRDLFQMVGRDSLHSFLLWPPMALPSSFGIIDGVVKSLRESFFLLFLFYQWIGMPPLLTIGSEHLTRIYGPLVFSGWVCRR